MRSIERANDSHDAKRGLPPKKGKANKIIKIVEQAAPASINKTEGKSKKIEKQYNKVGEQKTKCRSP